MKPFIQKTTTTALILISLVLSSCINLKHVNDFSTSAISSLSKFEDINYSFKQSCLDDCRDKNVNSLVIKDSVCNCDIDSKADSVTLLIYQSLKGYFDGLGKLSDKELTNYKTDALKQALVNGSFGTITIDRTQANAYSNLSNIILKAFTDKYRQNKIKEYITTANDPVKVLIHYLDLNMSNNLAGKLNVKKSLIKKSYEKLMKDSTINYADKWKFTNDYYTRLDEIDSRLTQLMTYSKALKKISEGHQLLFNEIDKITAEDLKEELTCFSGDLQNIISEFNKLKK